MDLKDLISLRTEIAKNDEFDYSADSFLLREKNNYLISKGERLLSLTYPSQLVKEIIKSIDCKLKNVQSISSKQELTVLKGGDGTGKTHALAVAYLLFNNFELTYSWLDKNEIKFNKFNTINIKKSKSCFISALKDDKQQLWKAIFSAFASNELLVGGEVPNRKELEQLIANQYTVIFIDDLEEFFIRLKQQQKDGLFEANKLFIKNLLKTAKKNDELILFTTAKKSVGPLQELFNSKKIKVKIKETEELSEIKKIVSHYLFNGNKDKAKIELKISEYLARYNKVELKSFEIETLNKQLIDYFPFQPDLVKIIDNIYKNNADKIESFENQINILGELYRDNYNSKNLITLSKVDYGLFKTAFPHLTESLKSSLDYCRDKSLWQSILKIIYFNILTPNKNRVQQKEIIKLLCNHVCSITFAELDNELKEMLKQLKYLKKDASGYYFKPKKDIYTLIKEKSRDINQQLAKSEMLKYLKEELSSKQFKIYGYNEWEDNKKIKYIIIPEISANKAELKDFIEDNFSLGYTYQNTFLFILTDENIFADKYLKQMKKIIAAQKLISKVEAEQKIIKLKKYFKQEKKKLNFQLADIFNNYYYWVDKGETLDICQKEISGTSLNKLESEIKSKIIDKSALKNYIIRQGEERFLVDSFLEASKQFRGMPFIYDKDFLFEVITELINMGELFFNQRTNKAYKSFVSWLEEKEIEVDKSLLENKLISYLKHKVFSQDYKIYGLNQLKDSLELDYVLLLDNVAFKLEKIKEILKENIYDKYNFTNAFAFIKPREKIFVKNNLLMVKKIEILKEANSQEIAKAIKQNKIKLIEKKLACEISARFGFYLKVEEKKKDLMIKPIEFKIDIAQAGQIINPESKILAYAKKMNKDFDNINALIKEVAKKIELSEAKKALSYFIKENLFTNKYKIFNYDKIADNQKIKYILLLENFIKKQELNNFLEKNIYQGRKFKNTLIIMIPKINLFTDIYFDKIRAIIALKNLKEKTSLNEKQLNTILTNKKKELIKELENSFKQLPVKRLTLPELKVDIKEKVKKAKGIELKELLLNYKTKRSYPIIIKKEEFYQAVKELKVKNKIIIDKKTNRLYKNTSSLINDTVKQITSDQAKEELINFVSNKLFARQYQNYQNISWDKFAKEEKCFLVLNNFETQKELKEFIKKNICNKMSNNTKLMLIVPKKNIFEKNYINKMKLILALAKVEQRIDWEVKKINLVLKKQEKKLLQQLKVVFGNCLYCHKKSDDYEIKQEELNINDLITGKKHSL